MDKSVVNINNINYDVYSLNTLIVGTGAAGYNAADSLINLSVTDVAILTEGINKGTSRNTGSDKQTFYKLTLSGRNGDSVRDMADTLFRGGAMHGDIALVEAALSARNFYKLADLGVPFPHNRYGEYVGYKTDHDPRMRATSAGPLTSKYMTERLESAVKQKSVHIFDEFLVVEIFTDISGEKTIGLAALDLNKLHEKNYGITLFNCTNIIYATGGPADIYKTSVYPDSQTGASGVAFLAGAHGTNLTESQYGISSIKFKWNLSGTYQQVIPRYVSTDSEGNDEREFLDEYFESTSKMLTAIFLKGYEWPFDPRKIRNNGSSLIDILVYNEIENKNRRVFLDFTKNPSASVDKDGKLDFTFLEKEPFEYMENSNALLDRPLDRLIKMNLPAVELYKHNGIDLKNEHLEIAVCAQHNNGGLLGNVWWESNLKHLFPVGEVNGTFGVYRPGGSALNSTQTGSFRAAQFISGNYTEKPLESADFINAVSSKVANLYGFSYKLVDFDMGLISEQLSLLKNEIKQNMTKHGANIRSSDRAEQGIAFCKEKLNFLLNSMCVGSPLLLPEIFKIYNILITQYVYLSAIKEYILRNGQSRGSYLIYDSSGYMAHSLLPEEFRFSLANATSYNEVCNIKLNRDKNGHFFCEAVWEIVREIPQGDDWFENVWEEYRKSSPHFAPRASL